MSEVSEEETRIPRRRADFVPRGDLCAVPDCPKPKYRHRNICNKHYMALYRHGVFEYQHVFTKPKTDISGQRLGTLTVHEWLPGRGWRCTCDCGKTRITPLWNLENGVAEPTCGDRITHYGDRVPPSYALAHKRVRARHGAASGHVCPCGNRAKQWSYDHRDPDEFMVIGMGPNPIFYSLNPERYRAMCTPCHKRFDLQYIAQGHSH